MSSYLPHGSHVTVGDAVDEGGAVRRLVTILCSQADGLPVSAHDKLSFSDSWVVLVPRMDANLNCSSACLAICKIKITTVSTHL